MKKIIRNCSECGKKIPQERLKALPNTETCVKCSQVKGVVGFVAWDSSPELIICDESSAEDLLKWEKSDGRMNRLK